MKKLTIALVCIGICSLAFFGLRSFGGCASPARVWMQAAQEVVTLDDTFTPPSSALLYAAVAGVYADTLSETGSIEVASHAAAMVLSAWHPLGAAASEKVFASCSVRPAELGGAEYIMHAYLAMKDMNAGITAKPAPNTEDAWKAGQPLSPEAGEWNYMVLGESISVPPPPPLFSPLHTAARQEVRNAATARTVEQSAAVMFWAGQPGSQQPAGIWQDRLSTVSAPLSLTEKERAYIQKVLAFTLYDAFVEAWRIKFTYWTKRPNHIDIDLPVSMDNPVFPGYVSGHATVSFAAATVLAHLLPSVGEVFFTDALEAKNSRLWAGIHYSYDNNEGEVLGRKVGKRVIDTLSLTSYEEP